MDEYTSSNNFIKREIQIDEKFFNEIAEKIKSGLEREEALTFEDVLSYRRFELNKDRTFGIYEPMQFQPAGGFFTGETVRAKSGDIDKMLAKGYIPEFSKDDYFVTYSTMGFGDKSKIAGSLAESRMSENSTAFINLGKRYMPDTFKKETVGSISSDVEELIAGVKVKSVMIPHLYKNPFTRKIDVVDTPVMGDKGYGLTFSSGHLFYAGKDSDAEEIIVRLLGYNIQSKEGTRFINAADALKRNIELGSGATAKFEVTAKLLNREKEEKFIIDTGLIEENARKVREMASAIKKPGNVEPFEIANALTLKSRRLSDVFLSKTVDIKDLGKARLTEGDVFFDIETVQYNSKDYMMQLGVAKGGGESKSYKTPFVFYGDTDAQRALDFPVSSKRSIVDIAKEMKYGHNKAVDNALNSIEEVSEQLSGAKRLIGYNIKSFDIPVLSSSGARLPDVEIVDLFEILSSYKRTIEHALGVSFGEGKGSTTLENVYKTLLDAGIAGKIAGGSHSADVDVAMTREVFNAIMPVYEKIQSSSGIQEFNANAINAITKNLYRSVGDSFDDSSIKTEARAVEELTKALSRTDIYNELQKDPRTASGGIINSINIEQQGSRKSLGVAVSARAQAKAMNIDNTFNIDLGGISGQVTIKGGVAKFTPYYENILDLSNLSRISSGDKFNDTLAQFESLIKRTYMVQNEKDLIDTKVMQKQLIDSGISKGKARTIANVVAKLQTGNISDIGAEKVKRVLTYSFESILEEGKGTEELRNIIYDLMAINMHSAETGIDEMVNFIPRNTPLVKTSYLEISDELEKEIRSFLKSNEEYELSSTDLFNKFVKEKSGKFMLEGKAGDNVERMFRSIVEIRSFEEVTTKVGGDIIDDGFQQAALKYSEYLKDLIKEDVVKKENVYETIDSLRELFGGMKTFDTLEKLLAKNLQDRSKTKIDKPDIEQAIKYIEKLNEASARAKLAITKRTPSKQGKIEPREVPLSTDFNRSKNVLFEYTQRVYDENTNKIIGDLISKISIKRGKIKSLEELIDKQKNAGEPLFKIQESKKAISNIEEEIKKLEDEFYKVSKEYEVEHVSEVRKVDIVSERKVIDENATKPYITPNTYENMERTFRIQQKSKKAKSKIMDVSEKRKKSETTYRHTSEVGNAEYEDNAIEVTSIVEKKKYQLPGSYYIPENEKVADFLRLNIQERASAFGEGFNVSEQYKSFKLFYQAELSRATSEYAMYRGIDPKTLIAGAENIEQIRDVAAKNAWRDVMYHSHPKAGLQSREYMNIYELIAMREFGERTEDLEKIYQGAGKISSHFNVDEETASVIAKLNNILSKDDTMNAGGSITSKSTALDAIQLGRRIITKIETADIEFTKEESAALSRLKRRITNAIGYGVKDEEYLSIVLNRDKFSRVVEEEYIISEQERLLKQAGIEDIEDEKYNEAFIPVKGEQLSKDEMENAYFKEVDEKKIKGKAVSREEMTKEAKRLSRALYGMDENEARRLSIYAKQLLDIDKFSVGIEENGKIVYKKFSFKENLEMINRLEIGTKLKVNDESYTIVNKKHGMLILEGPGKKLFTTGASEEIDVPSLINELITYSNKSLSETEIAAKTILEKLLTDSTTKRSDKFADEFIYAANVVNSYFRTTKPESISVKNFESYVNVVGEMFDRMDVSQKIIHKAQDFIQANEEYGDTFTNMLSSFLQSTGEEKITNQAIIRNLSEKFGKDFEDIAYKHLKRNQYGSIEDIEHAYKQIKFMEKTGIKTNENLEQISKWNSWYLKELSKPESKSARISKSLEGVERTRAINDLFFQDLSEAISISKESGTELNYIMGVYAKDVYGNYKNANAFEVLRGFLLQNRKNLKPHQIRRVVEYAKNAEEEDLDLAFKLKAATAQENWKPPSALEQFAKFISTADNEEEIMENLKKLNMTEEQFAKIQDYISITERTKGKSIFNTNTADRVSKNIKRLVDKDFTKNLKGLIPLGIMFGTFALIGAQSRAEFKKQQQEAQNLQTVNVLGSNNLLARQMRYAPTNAEMSATVAVANQPNVNDSMNVLNMLGLSNGRIEYRT